MVLVVLPGMVLVLVVLGMVLVVLPGMILVVLGDVSIVPGMVLVVLAGSGDPGDGSGGPGWLWWSWVALGVDGEQKGKEAGRREELACVSSPFSLHQSSIG